APLQPHSPSAAPSCPYRGGGMTAATALPAAHAHPRIAVLVLISGAILICFSAIFVKLSELGPVATGFYRMLLALPIFALWMVQERRLRSARRLPRVRAEWWELALCGFFLAADLAVWHWAIRMTSAANATLLGSMAPIYVALAGWLFFSERFRPLFLVGLALAIIGAALLLGVSFQLGGRSFL